MSPATRIPTNLLGLFSQVIVAEINGLRACVSITSTRVLAAFRCMGYHSLTSGDWILCGLKSLSIEVFGSTLIHTFWVVILLSVKINPGASWTNIPEEGPGRAMGLVRPGMDIHSRIPGTFHVVVSWGSLMAGFRLWYFRALLSLIAGLDGGRDTIPLMYTQSDKKQTNRQFEYHVEM